LLRDIEKLLKRKLDKEIIPGYEIDPSIKPEPIKNGGGGGGQARQRRGGGNGGGNRNGKPSGKKRAKSSGAGSKYNSKRRG